MEENRKIRVAITHGDTNGIGYELIFKTFSDPQILELCTPIIYGSPKVAAYHRKALNMEANFSIINKAEEAREGRLNLLTAFDDEVKVELGMPTTEGGHAALMALDKAITDCRANLYDALVMLPVNRSVMQGEGFAFEGQAQYIEACSSEKRKVMKLLVNDRMRIGLATDNVALKDVAEKITAENLKEKVTMLYDSMRRDFRISNPRVAVLALNPMAGKEEKEIIAPVVEELSQTHVGIFGPYTAESFFADSLYDDFDAVLCMYHDQGMVPFKTLTPEVGVEMLTGLPIVCTAPNQDVGYEQAGKGIADESALRQAIWLAIDVSRNRKEYDEPMAHPLPKLYHEKKDESEKVHFSIPKKHEGAIKESAQ